MKAYECEGCFSYGSIKERCFGFIYGIETVSIEDIQFCPCTECLVKPMCKLACRRFQLERLRKKRGIGIHETR